MALVESLLSAIVRADGDALVMHVGERPYVVAGTGTINISTHGLTLEMMTGMLSQLLPADGLSMLEEDGAVEHRVDDIGDDRFNVVAARGGDDIWIEIRRRRNKSEAAIAAAAAAGPSPEQIAAAEAAAAEERRRIAEAAAEEQRRIAAAAAAAAEERRVAAEAAAQEGHRLVAEAAAQEERRLAEAAAEEDRRVAAEAAAEEERRLAAEAVAEEKRRLAAEAAAEEERRLAAEAAAEEERRMAAEAAAAEEERRLAEEAIAEERRRVAAEASAAEEERRVAAEAAAAEEQRRLVAEAAAIEERRLAAEAAADEERRRLAEAVAEGERLLAAEAAAAEERRVAAQAAEEVHRAAAAAAAEEERRRMEAAAEEERLRAAEAAALQAAAERATAPVPELGPEAMANATIEIIDEDQPYALENDDQLRHDTPLEPAEAPEAEPAIAAQIIPTLPIPAEPVSPQALERLESPEPPPHSVVLPMTRTVRIEVPPRVPTSRSSDIERLLRTAAARGASALFLTSESRPHMRVDGDIRLLENEAVLTRSDVEAAIVEIAPESGQQSAKREATEWLKEYPELGRIRCTTFTDHRGPGLMLRMIATRAATAEQLGLSREVQALATEPQGLVLVAGPRASGKSTLLSALVDLVNRQRAEFVITLERQIRLVHDNKAALVSQREIRGGADEALAAARSALRENPDVLVVDDLISPHMVPLILTAASEGLLVFVSIAAPSTSDAVQRFVELASPEMRSAVQSAMAESFRGAVAQVLLKKSGGGLVAAREVLLATAPVARVIGEGQLTQLPHALESGRKLGMVSFSDTLIDYVRSGSVDVREAFRKAPDRDRLLSGLKREGIDTSLVERLA